MSLLSTLVVRLVGETDEFVKSMESAEKNLTKIGDNLIQTGGSLTKGITLPLVGAATGVTILANNFNEGMANVAALGDEAAARISEWGPMVQDIAVATGKSTGDMTTGLYQVVSAFGATSDTIHVLEMNAVAASAGLATTEQAIALTSAVTKAYGDTSSTAVQQVSDLALKTVSLGQTTFPQLAASIGRVTPLTAALGVSQEELFAVMATASGVTGQSAEVSTQLRGVLQSMMAPTADMSKLYRKLGVDSGEAMISQYGLQGSLDAIMTAADASGKPLQKFIGSIEGQTLAMALTDGLAGNLTKNLEEMSGAAGMTESAFNAQTQGVNATGFAMKQVAIEGQVLGERLGTALAPMVLTLITAITPLIGMLENMVTWFTGLDTSTQMIILGVIGFVAALGPLLIALGFVISSIGTISGLMATLATVSLGPIIPIVLGVAAAVTFAYLAWTNNWGGIRDFLTTLWTGTLQPIFATLVTWLQTNIPIALTALSNFWTGTLLPAITAVWSWLTTNLFPVFGALASLITSVVVVAVRALSAIVTGYLVPAFQSFGNWLKSNVLPVVQQFATWLSDKIGPAVDWLANGLQWLTGLFKDWAATLLTLKLPAWLTPGSPTPLQNALSGIGNLLTTLVTGIFGQFVTAIQNLALLPQLLQQAQMILTMLITQFQMFIMMLTTQFVTAFLAVSLALQDTFVPALYAMLETMILLQPVLIEMGTNLTMYMINPLDAIAIQMKGKVIPLWQQFVKVLRGEAGPALEETYGYVMKVKAGMDALAASIWAVVRAVQALAAALSNLVIPEAFVGGSPPPLAFWIWDIETAALDAKRQFTGFGRELAMAGGGWQAVNGTGAGQGTGDRDMEMVSLLRELRSVLGDLPNKNSVAIRDAVTMVSG